MFVETSQRAQKYLDSLDAHIRERIVTRLKLLEENPVPHDAKFIFRHEGRKIFRIRIGDHRALYFYYTERVLIKKIYKRPRIYDRGIF